MPSPQVATYDLQPEMSAYEVTDRLVEAVRSRRFDAVICTMRTAIWSGTPATTTLRCGQSVLDGVHRAGHRSGAFDVG